MPTRRRAISTPGERKDPAARGPASAALSLGLHVFLVALLVRLTVMPAEWFTDVVRNPPRPVERIGFLQLPRGAPPLEAPRRGGDNLPASSAPPATARIPVRPVAIPTGLPPMPSRRPDAAPGSGTGPLVGGGGDTRGVRPAYTDPRLWAPAGPVVTAPLSVTERLDSAMAPVFGALADSMRRAAANARDPNDWTVRIGGQRFGLDEKFIRLGPVSIPTPLLAFLPLNVGANPVAVERERRLSQMRAEIMEQAARAARDDDFQRAVQALRERKQKEREEKKKAEPPPPPPRITP
jgi:hypothetical protein